MSKQLLTIRIEKYTGEEPVIHVDVSSRRDEFSLTEMIGAIEIAKEMLLKYYNDRCKITPRPDDKIPF